MANDSQIPDAAFEPAPRVNRQPGIDLPGQRLCVHLLAVEINRTRPVAHDSAAVDPGTKVSHRWLNGLAGGTSSKCPGFKALEVPMQSEKTSRSHDVAGVMSRLDEIAFDIEIAIQGEAVEQEVIIVTGKLDDVVVPSIPKGIGVSPTAGG